MASPPVCVVFGARNVGRAVVADRLAAGWRAVAVARSEETLERLRAAHPAAEPLGGDAADPADVAAALDRAQELGALDLVVNAVTAVPRDHSFGGGPVAEAPPDRLASWTAGFLPPAFEVMRSAGARMARRIPVPVGAVAAEHPARIGVELDPAQFTAAAVQPASQR